MKREYVIFKTMLSVAYVIFAVGCISNSSRSPFVPSTEKYHAELADYTLGIAANITEYVIEDIFKCLKANSNDGLVNLQFKLIQNFSNGIIKPIRISLSDDSRKFEGHKCATEALNNPRYTKELYVKHMYYDGGNDHYSFESIGIYGTSKSGTIKQAETSKEKKLW